MNILLWILQALLAFHTLTGAIWKFSNTAEQTMPSLAAIPNVLWIGMAVIEILVAIALLLPLINKSLGRFPAYAALTIVAEVLLFSIIHLFSGDSTFGSVIYWLVVAAFSAFIAYGRFALMPIGQKASEQA